MEQEDDSEYEALVEITDKEYESGKEALRLWQEWFKEGGEPQYASECGGDVLCFFCGADMNRYTYDKETRQYHYADTHDPNCIYIRAKALIEGVENER